jgi:acetone carboxylase gamma subunit
MTRRRMSPTMSVEDGQLICSQCDHVLAAEGQAWKQGAALSQAAVHALPGAGLAVEATLVLRRFSCPGCGELLDTETALPGDPFLDDVLEPRRGLA